MRHWLAALVLLLWMGGYARCVAETSGALPAPLMLCCGSDHSGNTSDDGQDCSVCDAILKGGLFFGKISMMAGAMAAAAIVTGWMLLAVTAQIFRLSSLAQIGFFRAGLRPTWLLKWCEVLVDSGCPVRGPDALMA